MPLHELLVASPAFQRLILEGAPVEDLRNRALEEGMTILLQDGIRKVLQRRVDLQSVKLVCSN